MDKIYKPQEVEQKHYDTWESAGYFHSEPNPDKTPFTIVIPPPNITAQLHIGHALNNTIQDVLIRYKRMSGYEALWMPGTDHASIATEAILVKHLAAQGITKESIGRDEFLKHAWDWYDQYGSRIIMQLKKIGCSCDWERERFTMDEGLSNAVTEAFVRLHEKGYIYRGNRMINWCPVCKTSISDAEVEYEDEASYLYYLRYPAADGGEGITVATTRPETMIGDVAVAVNPSDARYSGLIGKNLILPLTNREIPVIADEYVEAEFGTGAVKITPAHDPNDFDMGKRHNLPSICVMNDDATMNAEAGKYEGMSNIEARKAIIADLKELGLLVKIEDYNHNVGHCSRCHATVEPFISLQWFVRMKELAEPAIAVVKSGEVKIVPERYEKTYLNWMENIRDWCISRQLWWGHRIPAWHCADCGEVTVARTAPETCPKCGSAKLAQDNDVLDTWFSSALWPFSTLGWPDKTPELEYYYPTSTLVTAYEIISLWVARMVFSGIEHMGKIPFDTVLITGIVRDDQGRKMSKSLGNGIDPLELVEKYGADAMRFSLISGTSAGNDMRIYDEKIEAARNFGNKIWNAARFVKMNTENVDIPKLDDVRDELDAADHWILCHLNDAVAEITRNLDSNELGLAAQRIYNFIWSEYCDWYIELAKPRLLGDDERTKRVARAVLVHTLSEALKLLHPFMPFITEEIYLSLGLNSDGLKSIMVSSWPTAVKADESLSADMDAVMELIRTVRNARQEMNVPVGKRASMVLKPSAGRKSAFENAVHYISRLAYASEISFVEDFDGKGSVAVTTPACEAFLPMSELVDMDKERERLDREIENVRNEIMRAQGKLKNEGFVSKAPAAVVEEERKKLERNEALLNTLKARSESFGV